MSDGTGPVFAVIVVLFIGRQNCYDWVDDGHGTNPRIHREDRKKFEDQSPVEALLLREKLGMKRYRKTLPRDREKKQILLQLGLQRIKEREENDFIPLGFRRRKINILRES